jgi:hypothetical protein
MKTEFCFAALPRIAALMAVPALAYAENKPEALYEITLDMDHDGKMDRAVLVLVGPARTDFHPLTEERYGLSDGESVDLYVYLAVGDEKLDLSREPTILKKAIVDPEETPWVEPLESPDNRALVVTSVYGWGASKTWGQSLTIVHRGGEFLVAGYTKDWDWNNHLADGRVETIIGGCDINLLTGKGVVSQGLDEESKPAEGKFMPVKLADWSTDKRPEACDF